MNKLNKNSINLGLKMLTIFAFTFIFIPFNHAAAQVAVVGCGEGGCNTSWGAPQGYGYPSSSPSGSYYNNSFNTNVTNYYNNGSEPAYQQTYQQSTYPNYQQSYQSAYQPVQVAYVPPVQQNIVYTPTPIIPTNVVYSTNVNPTRTVTRVITRTITRPANNNNQSTNNNSSNTTGTTNSTTSTTDNSANNLASNAIFGSSSFLPSGLIQWILFAIFVLLIIILVRRIFGAKKAYEETPMKYE